MDKPSLTAKIDKLRKQREKAEDKESAFNEAKHNAEARSKISKWILAGTFILLLLCFIYPFVLQILNYRTCDANQELTVPLVPELLEKLWTLLGPVVGFVVAFYFNEKSKNSN